MFCPARSAGGTRFCQDTSLFFQEIRDKIRVRCIGAPFYHGERKEYERDSAALERLKKEYAEIRRHLEELVHQGEISVYTKKVLVEMTGHVLQAIAAKYENIREGVKEIMGGRVLEYEAKTILQEGIKEGGCCARCVTSSGSSGSVFPRRPSRRG